MDSWGADGRVIGRERLGRHDHTLASGTHSARRPAENALTFSHHPVGAGANDSPYCLGDLDAIACVATGTHKGNKGTVGAASDLR